ADLSDPAQAAGLGARAAEALGGPVEVLVNNAGASAPMEDRWDEADWERWRRINFDAARLVTSGVATGMEAAGWGRIVNVTGAMTAPSMNAATPAKAALQSWSRTLAMELAPRGVTVNAVAPGRISTEQINERLHPTAESRQAFIDRFVPAGRFGEPEELAVMIVWLCSPLAGYVNGAAIPVDGAMIRVS
ncbi:MAG: SDR family oxidoreductase, partial [Pseudomonadota bacterium]